MRILFIDYCSSIEESNEADSVSRKFAQLFRTRGHETYIAKRNVHSLVVPGTLWVREEETIPTFVINDLARYGEKMPQAVSDSFQEVLQTLSPELIHIERLPEYYYDALSLFRDRGVPLILTLNKDLLKRKSEVGSSLLLEEDVIVCSSKSLISEFRGLSNGKIIKILSHSPADTGLDFYDSDFRRAKELETIYGRLLFGTTAQNSSLNIKKLFQIADRLHNQVELSGQENMLLTRNMRKLKKVAAYWREQIEQTEKEFETIRQKKNDLQSKQESEVQTMQNKIAYRLGRLISAPYRYIRFLRGKGNY